MKLCSLKNGVNPRRVRIFLAEKRVAISIEEFDMESAGHKAPAFLAKNPLGTLPVLELDDGTLIAESVAICRYFEESIPEPPLFGRSILERAQVEMWNRRMELELLLPMIDVFVHTHPFWIGKREQIPAWGEAQRKLLVERMRWLDADPQQGAAGEFDAGLQGRSAGQRLQRHADRQRDDQRRHEHAAEVRPAAGIGDVGDGGDGGTNRGAGGDLLEVVGRPQAGDVDGDAARHRVWRRAGLRRSLRLRSP